MNDDEIPYEDEDMAYERWRDDWCERLDEVITEAYNTFVKGKNTYYSHREDIFFKDVIAILGFITKHHVVVKDEKHNIIDVVEDKIN
jgi:hypothetical protein